MKNTAHRSPLAAGGLPCPPAAVDEFLAQPPAAVIETMRPRPGRVLVLGAGGKMGLHLCLMLQRALQGLGRNEDVVAVSRFKSLRDRDEFAHHGVEVRTCDLERPEELAALPDAAMVFFLAGVKFGTTADPSQLERLNVLMPRRVAERFKDSTIVAFSTGCVYPFVAPETGGATEQTPPAPHGDYATSCLAREQAFVESGLRHGTRAVLIRLNYSVEFRYGVLVDIALQVLRNEPVAVTMGHVNAIWQTDALAYAIRSLEIAACPAVPLNVTGAAVLSVREIAQCFGRLLGRQVQPTGQEAESAWLNNATYSHQLFGPPATSLPCMQEWIANWLLSGGEVWNKPTGFGRRDGRF